VLAHPVAWLSTLSEIMCCGYTGVTALRPDVGGGLRMCARVLSSSPARFFSLASAAALYLPPSFLLGSGGSAHCIFARVYTFINRLTYRAAYHHHIATRAGTGLD